MDSVLGQKVPPYEYIVIDGGSTDGSAELLRERSGRLAYWVSEKDAGIYQAMNKGARKATGDYCVFLNSGDWLLADDVLERLEAEIDGKHDIYYTDHWVSDGKRQWKCFLPRSLDVNYFTYLSISHPNSVIRRSLLEKAGYYKEDFKICSDWLFFLAAMYTYRASFHFMDTNIACFLNRGTSSASGAYDRIERERAEGVKIVFGDLAPAINELNGYRSSVYGYLVRNRADMRPIEFLLRACRFVFVRLRRIIYREPRA